MTLAYKVDSFKQKVIENRNKNWEKIGAIPKWAKNKEIGLDQFFTKPEIAKKCINDFLTFLKSKNENIDEILLIEPSAGSGNFYLQLPTKNKIGIDILPMHKDIKQQDFLTFYPNTDKKIAVIGNPPFGYRGWMALKFIEHASKFADYVGFILPMAFQSDGKGSPKFRVNMKLIKTTILPSNSFIDEKGKEKKINALWQIWEKGKNDLILERDCSEFVEIFTVDLRKERLCGINKMKQADCFIQRTYFNTPPKPVKNFKEVKYGCGYGIIIKKEKEKILKILHEIDWNKYSNLAAHNCKHISMYHIKKALIDKGIANEL